jgi:hypothetical protein
VLDRSKENEMAKDQHQPMTRKEAKAEVARLAKDGGGRGATGIGVVDRAIVAVTCPPVSSRRGQR